MIRRFTKPRICQSTSEWKRIIEEYYLITESWVPSIPHGVYTEKLLRDIETLAIRIAEHVSLPHHMLLNNDDNLLQMTSMADEPVTVEEKCKRLHALYQELSATAQTVCSASCRACRRCARCGRR